MHENIDRSLIANETMYGRLARKRNIDYVKQRCDTP